MASNPIFRSVISHISAWAARSKTTIKVRRIVLPILFILILLAGCQGQGDNQSAGGIFNFFDQQIAKSLCSLDRDSVSTDDFCSDDSCRIGYPEECCEHSVETLGWVVACSQPICLNKFGASKCCQEITQESSCINAIDQIDQCRDELSTKVCTQWWIPGILCRSSSLETNAVYSECWSECETIKQQTIANNLGAECTGIAGLCNNAVCRSLIELYQPGSLDRKSCQLADEILPACSSEVEKLRCPAGDSPCLADTLLINEAFALESDFVICSAENCTSANAIRISPDTAGTCKTGDLQPCGNIPCKWNQTPQCNEAQDWICVLDERCLSPANLPDRCQEILSLTDPADSFYNRTKIHNDQISVAVAAEHRLMFEEYTSLLVNQLSDASVPMSCIRHETNQDQIICSGDNPGHFFDGSSLNMVIYPDSGGADCVIANAEINQPDPCSETLKIKLTGIEWNDDFTKLRFSFSSDYPLAFDEYNGDLQYRNSEYSSTCSVDQSNPYVLSCWYRILDIDNFPRPATFEFSPLGSTGICGAQSKTYTISKREVEPSGSQPPAIIGRWSGSSDEHGPFSLNINSIDKEIVRLMVRGRSIEHNDYKISGCLNLGEDGVTTPFSGKIRYDSEEIMISILGTAVTDQQWKTIILEGTISSTGADYRAESGSGQGAWRTVDSNGDWTFEFEAGSTACDYADLNTPGMRFDGDVSQSTTIEWTSTTVTQFWTETNIACGSVEVIVPEDHAYSMDLDFDHYVSEGVEAELLIFNSSRSGAPDQGRYAFTCQDILGENIGAVQGADYFGQCNGEAPGKIIYDVMEDGILVSWESMDTGTDPDKADRSGVYEVEMWDADWESVFESVIIKELSHIIPFASFPEGSPGNPDGHNFGEGLDHLPDGTYTLTVRAIIPPEHPDGRGADCILENLDARITITKSGGSWW